ncbi:hypothetical protein BJX76DRAFT_319461 [Aspergillus varians]
MNWYALYPMAQKHDWCMRNLCLLTPEPLEEVQKPSLTVVGLIVLIWCGKASASLKTLSGPSSQTQVREPR